MPRWDEQAFAVEARTTKDVKRGEELLVTYIVPFQKRRERRAELLLKVRCFCPPRRDLAAESLTVPTAFITTTSPFESPWLINLMYLQYNFECH